MACTTTPPVSSSFHSVLHRCQQLAQQLSQLSKKTFTCFIRFLSVSSLPPAAMANPNKVWVGSCGIYIFKRAALKKLLDSNKRARDFGRELIPDAIRAGMKVRDPTFSLVWPHFSHLHAYKPIS